MAIEDSKAKTIEELQKEALDKISMFFK